MKIVEKECQVPAWTYINKTYIALDGKEFTSEDACLRYEKHLEIENHPIYASAIKDVYTFEDEHYVTLYYISNQEDYEYFKETQGIKSNRHFNSDFEKYGAGWYLFYTVDGGCTINGDDFFLYNYDAYEKDIELRWNEYKEDIRHKMEQKRREN